MTAPSPVPPNCLHMFAYVLRYVTPPLPVHRSWMRMRYPDALSGMIAGSAPILSFEGLSPAYDPSTYDLIVTRDAGGPASGLTTHTDPHTHLVQIMMPISLMSRCRPGLREEPASGLACHRGSS